MIGEKVTAKELRKRANTLGGSGLPNAERAMLSAADRIDELEARNKRLEEALDAAADALEEARDEFEDAYHEASEDDEADMLASKVKADIACRAARNVLAALSEPKEASRG